MLSIVVFAFIGIGTSFLPRKAAAATASTINFQARLLSSSGNIVPDGTYNMEFKVYDSLSSGASAQGVCSLDSSTDDCWWLETRTGANKVTVKNGYLSVGLGSVTAFGSSINWNQDLWITMNIGGTGAPSWDGEMSPRMKLASVPYAQSATKLNVESGGNTGLLQFASLTGNRTITAPDQTGTILLNTVLTTEGDIYYRNATDVTRLARGSNGQCLTSNATTIIWGVCGDGASTIGSLDGGTANANGATILSNVLYLQSASATYPGLVSTATQTFVGVKTFNDNMILGASKTLRITGDITANRPVATTAGQLYYDTVTNEMLVSNGTKWVSDRSVATKIVAASNSSQAIKDAADYVADGTGDQVEINAALTAASGGKVYLAEGTYSISATVLVPNNTTLAGAGRGTLVQLADIDATDNMVENADASTGTGVVIQDLRLDGQKSVQTGAITQHGIYMMGMGSGDGASAIPGVVIMNTWVDNLETDGVCIVSSSNNRIINSVMTANGRHGIQLDAAYNSAISSNIAQGNGEHGVTINAGARNTIVANVLQGNLRGVYMEDADNNTITGNIARESIQAGISLYLADNNAVVGNNSQNNTIEGIVLDTSNNNLISSNKIANSSGATNNDGIKLTSSDANTIIGNDITDSSCTINCYAINVSNGTSNRNYIGDNHHTGAGAQYPSTINDASSDTVYASQQTPTQFLQSSSSLIRASATSVITGSIDPTASASVTGVGTYFLSELQVGDRITVSGETRTIIAIASNTSLTVAAPFSNNANDTSVDRLPAALVVADSTGAAKVTVGDDGSLNVGSGTLTVGTASTAGQITVTDGSNNAVIISVNALANNYTLAIPTLTANDTFCLQGVANCSGAGASAVGALDGGTANANGATITSNTLYLQSASASYAGLVNTAAQTFAGDKTFNGNILAGGSATGTTATTSGTGTNTTTLTFTGTTSFANNDIIFIDNAGQDYYTRIVSGASAASVTVSPAITFENARTVTKYTAQNIGATSADYTTQTNRFFQGYFTGGVVTGAGSTIYSDGMITAGPGLTVKNPTNTTNAFQVQNAASSTTVLDVDTANNRVGVGTAAPTASLHVATGNMIIDGAYTGNTPKLSVGGTIVDSDTTSNYGFHNQVYFQKATNVTHLYGLNNIPVIQTGAGNVSNAYGALSRVETRSGYDGTITNAYSFFADQPSLQNDAKPRISQFTGFYAQMPTTTKDGYVGNSGNTTGTIYNSGLKISTGTAQAGSGGTLNNMSLNVELSSGNTTGTNNYGLYLTGNGGVSATSNYAIYSNSTANSYLAGKLGISNTAPANKLNVNTPYTAVTGADLVVTATDADTIPLVVQVAATPNVNAFQVRSSAGAVQSGFTASGRLFVNTTAAITGVSITSATGTNTTVGQVIQGAASQSADLFQLRDNNGLINASFNGAGNQLTLGRIAASGTVTQGKLLFSDGTTDNFSSTLQSATLTGNRTITLPNADGTLCVKSGSNTCGATSYTKIVAASNSPQAFKDVADYVADGTADQTEINSALTAAAGGTVYLAEGTYTASATITIPNNTTLAGAGVGTVIQLADLDATENLIENTDTTAGTGVVIRDLKIDGRSDLNTAGTQHGIYMLAMGGAVTDITRKGATVENVTITRFRNDGIQLDTSGQSHISQVYALSNGNYGIYLTASHRTTIANSLAQANTSSNIRLNSGSTSNTITGNTLRDSTNSSGIRIDGSSHYNTVTGNSSASNSSGISLSNSNYITITGNTSTDEDLYGIWLAGSNYNVISSNTVSNSGSATTNNGIYVDDSDYNSFIGNVITDDQCDTTCYAINIFNTTTNSNSNYLASNRISDTDATYDDNATIRDAGTNTSFGNQVNSAQILQSSSSYISANGTTVITGSIDPAASTSVTGVSTIFTKELQVGDKITVTGETRTITAIASDTSLTVDTAFSNNANDTSVDRLPAGLVIQGSHNALSVLNSSGSRIFNIDTTNERVDVIGSYLRITGTTTSNVGLQLNGSNFSIKSTDSSSQYGIQNQPGFDLSTITGGAPAGTLTALYGMINIADIKVAPSNKVVSAYGEYVRVDNTAGATVDNSYALRVANGGAATNSYGVFVERISSGATTNFPLYVADNSSTPTPLFSVDNQGVMVFRTRTNSTTAFQFQNSANGSVLTLNTTNGNVSIDANAQQNQRLCHSGADGAAQNDVVLGDCLTGGADHAEMYEVIGTAEPGDVVASKGQYSVGVTNAMYQADALGVISTNPVTDGILGMQNTNKATRQPVGLAGRVPVKLSLENGPIQIGDYLTASSTPGFAMKATGSGRVVGIALENFNSSSPRVSDLVAAEEVARDVAHAGELPSYRSNPALWPANTGKVMMFVNPTFYSAPINSVLQGTDAVLTENAIIGGSIAAGGDLNVSGATTLSTLTVTGQAVFNAKLYVAEVETGTITINGHIITSGTAPAVAVGQAAGAADGASGIVGPSAIIEGNDTSGTITLVTGVNTAADELVRVMFNSGFSDRPRVIISATNKQTARLGAYTDAGATTPEQFSIFANVQPEPTTEYKFTYFVVQ